MNVKPRILFDLGEKRGPGLVAASGHAVAGPSVDRWGAITLSRALSTCVGGSGRLGEAQLSLIRGARWRAVAGNDVVRGYRASLMFIRSAFETMPTSKRDRASDGAETWAQDLMVMTAA